MADSESTKRVYPRILWAVIDSTHPRRLAEFYRQLLGYEYAAGHEAPPEGEPDPDGDDWLNLVDPNGGVDLAFQKVDALPRSTWPEDEVPQQIHLDTMVLSREELDRQHRIALDLGATVLDDQVAESGQLLRVYADPEGHPFCIFVWAED